MWTCWRTSFVFAYYFSTRGEFFFFKNPDCTRLCNYSLRSFFSHPRWVPGRLVYPVHAGLGLFASASKTIVSILNRGRMWEASLEAVRTPRRGCVNLSPSPVLNMFLSCCSDELLCCLCKQRSPMSSSSICKDAASCKNKTKQLCGGKLALLFSSTAVCLQRWRGRGRKQKRGGKRKSPCRHALP